VSKQELLRMMRLLSGLESVMLIKERVPDYLLEQLNEMVDILEREILK
jgi:hypothetical protein